MKENQAKRFQYRLALGLGKTLSEIEHVSREEMLGWMAFYQLEPWGCYAEDDRARLLAGLTYRAHFSPTAPIPDWFERDGPAAKPDPTPEELDDSIRDFFAGKTVIKKARKPPKPRKPKPPAK